MSNGRGQRLDEFLLGVEDTYGHLASSGDEKADFIQAAREFYLDYAGYGCGHLARLPFWRYLLHFAAVGVDHTAGRPDDAEPSSLEEAVATQISSQYPLIAVLATRKYRYSSPYAPASAVAAAKQRPKLTKAKSTTEIGCQTEVERPVAQQKEDEVPSPGYTP